MNPTAPGTHCTRRADGAWSETLRLPLALARRLQAAIARYRWRRARPFLHLNDHLRRDVGLPPLDERSSGP